MIWTGPYNNIIDIIVHIDKARHIIIIMLSFENSERDSNKIKSYLKHIRN